MPKLLFSILCLSIAKCSASQNFDNTRTPFSSKNSVNSGKINDSVSVWIMPHSCKNSGIVIFLSRSENRIPDKKLPVPKPEPLITVHGNVLYNFSYRSYLDTPFAQTGLMQHLILTTLDLTIKNKYPLRVQAGVRNNNSPYFKSSIDINITYSRRQLMENIRDGLRKKLLNVTGTGLLSETENKYQEHIRQARVLKAWINNPARPQEIIEEKEQRVLFEAPDSKAVMPAGNMDVNTEVVTDWTSHVQHVIKNKSGVSSRWRSLQQRLLDSSKKKLNNYSQNILADISERKETKDIAKKLNAKKEELKRLETLIKSEEVNLREQKKALKDSLNNVRREINSLSNSTSLFDFMKRNGLSKDSLTKEQKVLLSFNEIGVGRIFLDYSELTAKNMSLTGGNIEANPGKFYFAAAAGKINYRFRDFILKSDRYTPSQSLYILRAGIGKIETNNLVFSFYNGKKNQLSYPSLSYPSSSEKVLGVSAEARWTIDANNYIITEVAKSSYNNNGTIRANSSLLDKAFDLKTHTNEAYSIKLYSQYPSTRTKLTAWYRNMGENFQSFNLYPSAVNEEAWMVKINQPFWKGKLTVEAAVRKNDFASPIAAPASNSAKTVFKSMQATLHIRKYPFVSIGYYPSSQLSLTNNNMLVENQYNTFNGVISHSYQINTHSMNTTAVFTEFYNNSTDTGFIYFNAKTFNLNHTVFLSSLTSQSGVSLTEQKNIQMVTLEQTIGYRIKNNFSLNAGIKCNRFNRIKNLWGETVGVSFVIKNIGSFQMNYDKIFLPGYNRVLMPVDMGRAAFYKIF